MNSKNGTEIGSLLRLLILFYIFARGIFNIINILLFYMSKLSAPYHNNISAFKRKFCVNRGYIRHIDNITLMAS